MMCVERMIYLFGFKKKIKYADIDKPDTIIGKGVNMEAARINSTESIRINGVYKGNVDINGSLVLGEGASIKGDVTATYFLVAGEVIGNVSADTLHLSVTSKLTGDVQARSLIIDQGAQLEGR